MLIHFVTLFVLIQILRGEYLSTEYGIINDEMILPFITEEQTIPMVQNVDLQDFNSYSNIHIGYASNTTSIVIHNKEIKVKVIRAGVIFDTFLLNYEYYFPEDSNWVVNKLKKGVGLGYQKNQTNSVISQLKKQKIINKAIFSIDKKDRNGNGLIFFGDIPDTILSNYSFTCNLGSHPTWGCVLNGLIVSTKTNQKRIPLNDYIVFQTNGEYILIPDDVNDYLKKNYFDNYIDNKICDYIVEVGYKKKYICKCDIQNTFPDITLILNGNHFVISHSSLFINKSGICHFIFYSIENKYLTVEEGIIGDLSNLKDNNAIVLISDDRANPYANINKIFTGYDKFINLFATDTIVFAEPKYDSSEKLFVKIENELAKYGCNVIDIPKNYSILQHASKEDLMLMIKLVNPTYYMPVKGDYRYMVGNANVASSLGISNENIILKQNGDIVNIDDKVLQDKFEHFNVDDIFIDGKSSDDIGDLVIKDREVLAENGIVLISATVSKKEKVLLVGPEIVTRGFIYVKDSKEMIEEIKKICEKVINDNITPKYVDYNLIRSQIREELGKYLYEETECKPMIIAVVQEV